MTKGVRIRGFFFIENKHKHRNLEAIRVVAGKPVELRLSSNTQSTFSLHSKPFPIFIYSQHLIRKGMGILSESKWTGRLNDCMWHVLMRLAPTDHSSADIHTAAVLLITRPSLHNTYFHTTHMQSHFTFQNMSVWSCKEYVEDVQLWYVEFPQPMPWSSSMLNI